MEYNVKTEGEFKYIEAGEGKTIVVLHGLMGTLDDFAGVVNHFSKNGYQVLVPEMPIYTLPIIKTNIKNLAKFVKSFMEFKNIPHATLLGNSAGGHVSLYITKTYPELVDSLILTGSSGLYEAAMGDTYPKRGDYEWVTKKAQEVFYDPKTATKEIVDNLFNIINDRNCAIRILALAKSAIRHNMAKDLPEIKIPTCLIWGKQDEVTPPEVAEEFNKLMPNSELYWVDKCGHAAMMEHPDSFNDILTEWFDKNNIK